MQQVPESLRQLLAPARRLEFSPRYHKWRFVVLPEPAENSDPSWFGFLISVRPETGLNRNDVTKYIESKNVQTRLLFSGNIIKQPCFNEIRGTNAYRVVGSLENSDFVVNNTFWVGVYPGMTDAMIDYMAQVIKEAVGK